MKIGGHETTSEHGNPSAVVLTAFYVDPDVKQ